MGQENYKEFVKILKREMIKSKYEQLNTQSAKDYNSFVDWWLKKIDVLEDMYKKENKEK